MPALDRIQRTDTPEIEAPATITPTSVTVTTLDGTVLVAATATTGTYQLLPAHTLLLDTLVAAWTDGTRVVRTRHEIVGGFLFDADDLAAVEIGTRRPNQSPETIGDQYTDKEIRDARTYAEQGIEDECGFAFVPRYSLVRGKPTGYGALDIGVLEVTAIRSVVADGIAWTPSQIAALDVDGPYLHGYWWGDNVRVGVEHGRDAPDEEIRNACLDLARDFIVRGPVDPRALTQNDQSGNPIQMAVPGMRIGDRWGLRGVQAVCDRHKMLVGP